VRDEERGQRVQGLEHVEYLAPDAPHGVFQPCQGVFLPGEGSEIQHLHARDLCELAIQKAVGPGVDHTGGKDWWLAHERAHERKVRLPVGSRDDHIVAST